MKQIFFLSLVLILCVLSMSSQEHSLLQRLNEEEKSIVLNAMLTNIAENNDRIAELETRVAMLEWQLFSLRSGEDVPEIMLPKPSPAACRHLWSEYRLAKSLGIPAEPPDCQEPIGPVEEACRYAWDTYRKRRELGLWARQPDCTESR